MHLQKLLTFFSRKNTCDLDIVLTRTVNVLATNEFVKVTMLWTTGPRLFISAGWSGSFQFALPMTPFLVKMFYVILKPGALSKVLSKYFNFCKNGNVADWLSGSCMNVAKLMYRRSKLLIRKYHCRNDVPRTLNGIRFQSSVNKERAAKYAFTLSLPSWWHGLIWIQSQNTNRMVNSVDPDETARCEPSHLDLHGL